MKSRKAVAMWNANHVLSCGFNYRRVRFLFPTLACILTAFVTTQQLSLATATVDEGWNALLTNDVRTAETVFQACVKQNPKDLDAWDGLAISLWTRGDMPQAAETWMELARRGSSRPWWAGYLAALALPELQGIAPKQRAKLLKDLKSNPDLSSFEHQKALWSECLDWEEKWGDPKKARQAAERYGAILDWWFVLGPFGAYGTMDLWEPFPPEKDLAPASFPGWISTVSRREIPKSDPTGKLDLESLLYPSEGTAYAFTAIESEGDAPAQLIVECPGDFVVWWDGHPKLMRCVDGRDFFTEATVDVRLRKGVIPLLVKSCRRGSDWWVRISLHPSEQKLPNWRVAKTDENVLSKVVTLPLTDTTPRLQTRSDAETPRHKMLAAFYNSLTNFRKAEFTEAQDTLAPAIEANLAQAFVLLGDLRMREAARRPQSRSRLQREAEEAYRKAVERYPAAIGAHTGLVSYLLERDNIDQALEYVETIEEQLTQEDVRYRAGIDYALGLLFYRKNWTDESLAALRRSVQSLPPSAEVFRRIARIQADLGDRVGALETAKNGLAIYPHHEWLAEEAISQLKGGELDRDLRSNLAQRLEIHPYRLSDYLRMVRAWRNSGQEERAKELCEQLAKLFPDRPEPLRELARIDATADNTDISTGALSQYRRLLEIAPHDNEARKTLRQAGQSEDELIERYDVRLEDLDLSQADRWKESRAPDIFLIDVMVTIVDHQGTYRQYIHQAVKVLNKDGRQRWAETVIPKGNDLEIRLARSILPDGTEWPVQHVADLGNQQALSMYGVEDGTIIEYAYLQPVSGNLRPGGNHYTGGYFFGAVDEPMLVSKMTLIMPGDMECLLEVKPKEFGTRDNLENGRVALVWENRLQDGVRQESFMPPVAEVVSCLRASTWTDWRIGLERWHEQLLGRFEEGPELETIVGRFKEEKTDKSTLVRKVYDWIQKQIEPAGGSYTTLDTAILRVGSGWEKTLLAHEIFRRLGIPSAPGVVVKNQPEDGFAPQPVAGFSGQLLLRVDVEEETPTWLDFSSRHIAAGEVDGENRGGIALVLAEDGEYFEPVDPAVWPRGWVDRSLQLCPNADRSTAVEGSYAYCGTHRRSLLSLIVDKEKERQFRDSQVSGDLRGIVIDSTELRNADSPYGTPRLQFSGKIPNFLQAGEEKTLRLSAVPCQLKISGLVAEVTRETPVDFSRPPVTEPLEVHLDLGPMREAGYNIGHLPQDYIRLTPFGYYALTFRRQGDHVTIKRSAIVPPQTIETENYGKFAAFCRGIDEAERQDIVFMHDE
ncbi:MAG: DUF3857 domain-containing protein [bacterium]